MEQELKRPFATFYYRGVFDPLDQPVHQGAAKTEVNARRATVVRIIIEQYAKAVIIDRHDGTVLYTLRHAKSGITISFGRS